MGDFAGWQMPIWYKGIKEEHNAVRNDVGIFDISHMGEFYFEGKDALEFLEYTSISNISKLNDGDSLYTCILNERGAIKDEAVIYKLKDDFYAMVCDAVAYQKLDAWFNTVKDSMSQKTEIDLKITNKTNDLVLLAIQGPASYDLLEKAFGVDLSDSKRFTAREWEYNGHPIIISVSGYTREKGFELLFEDEKPLPKAAPEIWQKLIDEGAQPCGLGARNTIRVECGFTLYEHETYEKQVSSSDIDESTPLEVNFGWMINWDKNFIGKQALTLQKEQGPSKKMSYLEIIDRGIPRGGYPIQKDGKQVGMVTSGTLSPLTDKGIAICFLPPEYEEGEEVDIIIRDRPVKAKVVKAPFYDREKYGANRTVE